MTTKKTHLLRKCIVILLVFGILGLGLTGFLFFRDPTPTYVGATIEFTFEGAADGLAPNGAAFNLSDITATGVLSAALETAGLQERYTPDQLVPCITVRGVYPNDMAKQVMSYDSLLDFTANRQETITTFHPTTFNVTLTNEFDKSISQGDLEALMEGLMTAYRAYFAKTYANGLQRGNMLFTLDNYDYPQQLEIIQGHFTTLSSYAQEMYGRRPDFRLNGSGFNDIGVRLNNLINSDIARLNADLTMNALTRDTARLLTQYQFEIRDLSNQLDKQKIQLEKMDALINSYDKNEIIYLSTTDSLTKIDGNSSETYDKLVDQRKKVSDGITEINSQIASFRLKLSDLLKEDQNTKVASAASEAAPAESASPAEAAAPTAEAEAAGTAEAGTDDASSAAEVVETMTDAEISEAAAEAERLARSQTVTLEKNIATLVEKGSAIIDDFQAMLQAYNDQQINEGTVTVSNLKYKTPKILSGAFIKKAIKTAGPICAIGFMLCMVLVIVSRKREEKG